MADAAFLKGETWGFAGTHVERVETHAAEVFLVGNRAFKIKKPVKLPYLDFSDIQKRRKVLKEELEINRAFAPSLYLQVAEVRGEPVLVMRRFGSHALLSWKIAHGGIDVALPKKLAAMIAECHVIAPRHDAMGSDIMMRLGAQLSKAFIDSTDLFEPSQTLEFHALYEEALRRKRSLLNERSEQGLVRRCHGDMHAGNIIVEHGNPMLFDAIEFNEKIATIDVLYDLAFLLMDLWSHGEKAAANIVMNRYLNLRRAEENLSGLSLLPLFLSTRAGVRALVTADLVHELPVSSSLRQRGQALDSFRDSILYLKPDAPMLICVGGLSGSGKSTLAAGLAPHIGASPGALHVRSDVERKILAGVGETEKLPPETYSRQSSITVYSACFDRAEAALSAGHSVVLDAVFAHDSERSIAAFLAVKTRAAFLGIWLDAPAEVLRSRVTTRRNDASDATEHVVDLQLGYNLDHLDWPRIDASGTPAETLARVRERLPSQPGGPA